MSQTASSATTRTNRTDRDSERRKVGRNSLVMASGTLASRLTGQIRTIMLTAAIGVTGIAADAYQVGSQIPQVFFNIISGGLINAILVPQIVRTFQQRDYRDRLNKLLTFSGTVLILFTAILTVCTPLLVNLYVNSGWTNAQKALANSFTLWCMPQILFYGIYTVVGQVLAARDKFAMYAWSSVAANIISIVGFGAFLVLFGNAQHQPLSFWTQDKIALLAGSWTLGIAVQALLLFIPLYRIGIHPRVKWGLHGFGLRSMSRVGMWTIGMVILDQIAGMVTTRVTTGAPIAGGDRYGIAGSQAYQQAFQIYILPYSLIVVSVATAIFPVLSRSAAKHQIDRFRDQLSHAIRVCVVIMTFFAAGFISYPIPIVKAVLPSVSVHDAHLMSLGLIAIALNLPLASITLLIRRSFFAFEDGRDQFIVSAILDVVTILVLLVGMRIVPPYYWICVACSSTVIGRLVMLPIDVHLIRRKLDGRIDGKRITSTTIRSLIAGIVVIPLGRLLQTWSCALVGANLRGPASGMRMRWWQSLIVMAICGLLTLAAYVGLLLLMRVSEVRALLTIAKGRTARLSARLHHGQSANESSSAAQGTGDAGSEAGQPSHAAGTIAPDVQNAQGNQGAPGTNVTARTPDEATALKEAEAAADAQAGEEQIANDGLPYDAYDLQSHPAQHIRTVTSRRVMPHAFSRLWDAETEPPEPPRPPRPSVPASSSPAADAASAGDVPLPPAAPTSPTVPAPSPVPATPAAQTVSATSVPPLPARTQVPHTSPYASPHTSDSLRDALNDSLMDSFASFESDSSASPDASAKTPSSASLPPAPPLPATPGSPAPSPAPSVPPTPEIPTLAVESHQTGTPTAAARNDRADSKSSQTDSATQSDRKSDQQSDNKSDRKSDKSDESTASGGHPSSSSPASAQGSHPSAVPLPPMPPENN